MVRLQADVSNRELDALEDLAVVWNLCEKHNAAIEASEDDRWRFTQTCPKCKEINKKLSSKVLHLWSKLVTAYEKSRKKQSAGKKKQKKRKND